MIENGFCGFLVGRADGLALGLWETVGVFVGCAEGLLVGLWEVVGELDGRTEGLLVGLAEIVGCIDGGSLGALVGPWENEITIVHFFILSIMPCSVALRDRVFLVSIPLIEEDVEEGNISLS